MKNFYEEPTQVVFADPDNEGKWIAGIAYKDEVICACCGGVFEICNIIESTKESGVKNPIYEYRYWVDFVSEIVGGELPDGLDTDEDITRIFEVPTEDETYSEWENTMSEEDEAMWLEYFDSQFPQ
jgi:hypothetical protein